jgi:hypothetical protein
MYSTLPIEHKRDFLLKFPRDRCRWLQWLFDATKRFKISILNYSATSNHVHLENNELARSNPEPGRIEERDGRKRKNQAEPKEIPHPVDSHFAHPPLVMPIIFCGLFFLISNPLFRILASINSEFFSLPAGRSEQLFCGYDHPTYGPVKVGGGLGISSLLAILYCREMTRRSNG